MLRSNLRIRIQNRVIMIPPYGARAKLHRQVEDASTIGAFVDEVTGKDEMIPVLLGEVELGEECVERLAHSVHVSYDYKAFRGRDIVLGRRRRLVWLRDEN
ncbi:hypothetical protein COL922a_014359, partial [Colletotrichum nupharicola]